MSRLLYFRTSKILRGFSLVEVLVYISVFTIVSIGSLSVLFSLEDVFARHRVNQIVTHSAETALDRMTLSIRSADMVATADPDTVLITTPGHLVLIDGATTTEFSLATSTIVLTENDIAIGPLTDADVTVTELRFFRYDNGVTVAVRVLLSLSATLGDVTVAKTFSTTAVLRGSYD